MVKQINLFLQIKILAITFSLIFFCILVRHIWSSSMEICCSHVLFWASLLEEVLVAGLILLTGFFSPFFSCKILYAQVIYILHRGGYSVRLIQTFLSFEGLNLERHMSSAISCSLSGLLRTLAYFPRFSIVGVSSGAVWIVICVFVYSVSYVLTKLL